MNITKTMSMAVAVIGLAVFCATSTQASAASCNMGQYMFGTGKAKHKGTAKKRGRRNWAAKVIFKYGAKFRHWDKATSRQYGCDKKGKRWHCTAFAYPCK